MNPTEPVALEGETVAVNVTGCHATAGFGLDDTVVVVGALPTLCTRIAEPLAA
jgi:hypothetical protein